jgi:hypothetical protein
MDATVKKAKLIEVQKTFTSKKANIDIQPIQPNRMLNLKRIIDIVKQLSDSEKQQLREALGIEPNFDDIVIPKEHKQIVRERIKKYENSPDSYLSWNDIENKMTARK